MALHNYSVVDLFCGVGGLTHGLVREGFNVSAGIDLDSTCKGVYEKNNPALFITKDVGELTGRELKRYYPKGHRKILVGCAPCQPFSIYAHGRSKSHNKWELLESFARLINEVKPDVVSMENVPQLLNVKNKGTFLQFVDSLIACKYNVTWFVVDSKRYGVPQRRKRLVLFASRFGPISIIPPTHGRPITVRDAIEHLPPINNGETLGNDPLHSARKLSPLNLTRIRHTPEGGGWRQWPKSLILDCHKTENGRLFGSVYGRMKWDEVSPTMTTFCVGLSNGRFGHPSQDRAISLREAAILQSFPEQYDFIDESLPFSSTRIAKHIGNAVPVRLGQAIALSIKNHLKEHGKA
jgi:DNA (cytosine-5)-methyltransferase 1